MPEESPRPLEVLRKEIDELDAELVRLLNARAQLAQEVGQLKGTAGLPYFTPERERAIFERLRDLNQGPLGTPQIVNVFREIISAARALEQGLRVAFWGPEGTFSHLAALQSFGRSIEVVPTDSIAEVFHAVQRGAADYGVVPISNSVGGVIPETLDEFTRHSVRVCAETVVPIVHQLVSACGSLSDVRRVYAGPQPYAQCRRWLRSHVPDAEVVEVAPTVRAVERALTDPHSAAIANALAAERYGAPILVERVHDDPSNRTRFVILGFNEPKPTGRDKSTVLFRLPNRPGELYKALGAFVHHQVNLLMIESRPSPRGAFEVVFFAEAEGHREDEALSAALAELGLLASEVTVIGSYPAADPA